MASDKKLTRYTSAVTIVTADVMNSLYGGEYGYNDSVDGFHPLVFGHIHDGTHEDGHASKILLTNGAHVRGYLANANLGGTDGTTPAVRYSNIMCYSDATYGSPAARRAAAAAGGYDLEILAIPEYTEDPTTGEKCYYLDLSNSAGGIDGSVQYNEDGSFSGNNDLFYDYTNLRFGAGTTTPQRKVHIVDTTNPPLRVDGITSILPLGSGTPLVIDGSGDVYSDATIVATPGGSDESIQFNDLGTFGGDSALTYNKVASGSGSSGPKLFIRNLEGSDTDLDRRTEIVFAGKEYTTNNDINVSGIVSRHIIYGGAASIGVNNVVNAGGLLFRTNNPSSGWERAILIASHSNYDNKPHVGIGATSFSSPVNGFVEPARRLHIMESNPDLGVDPGYSPLRINNLIEGVGSLVLWDGTGTPSATDPYHQGDVYHLANGTQDQILRIGATGYPEWAAAPTSSQDAYKFIDLTGNTSGITDIDATIADDTLTITGGTGIRLDGAAKSIEINNTQQAFQTITRNNVGTGTSSGADVIADQINDTLTIEAGNNIDVTLDSGNDKITISANVPAAENQFYSQWAGAAQWTPVRGIGAAYPREPKYIQLIKLSGGGGGSPIVSDRNIWVLCKTDYTVGSTGIADGGLDGGLGPTAYVSGPPEDHNSSALSGSYFDLLVPIPVNGNLSAGSGASTDGSNQGGLPAYQDAVPLISSDAPTSCRVTAYFILDEGGTQNSSVRFNINIGYNGLGAPNLDFTQDGKYMSNANWIYGASTPTQTLENQHNYPSSVSDGMMVVSDFSPLKISVANPKDGMASFRLRVTFPSGYDPIDGTYFSGLEGQEALYNCFKFIGARLLWIWE